MIRLNPNAVHTSPYIGAWQAETPTHTVRELTVTGTGTLILTERDLACLAELYDKHYLQGDHFVAMGYFPRRQTWNARFLRLYHEGLVARAKYSRHKSARKKEYVYGLTRHGMDVLASAGDGTGEREFILEIQEALAAGWEPPYLAGGQKTNVFHELDVADFCAAVLQYAAASGIDAEWGGSRRLEQRIPAQYAGGSPLRINPDATLYFPPPSLVGRFLVEHQKISKEEDLTTKLTRYQRYFTSGAYRLAYGNMRPILLLSVGSAGAVQKGPADPYKRSLEIARTLAFKDGFFIPEARWRALDLTFDAAFPKERSFRLEEILEGRHVFD